MVQYGEKDSASVGIKLPNGTYERPMGKNRLLWVRPGKGLIQTKGWKKKLLSPMQCCRSCTSQKRAVVSVLVLCRPQNTLLLYSFKCFFFLSLYNET